ncbi:MAG: hypothetical protein ABW022_24170 [Actinoplanes sp.]
MTTLAAVLSVLLAGVSVLALVIAVVVIVRGRRGGTVRMFGRALHRPRLWAAAVACLGVAGLLRTGGEALPDHWHGPGLVLDIVLSAAFIVLLSTHLASQQRARRR